MFSKKNDPFSFPPFLALFQKRIDGDDALLRLAGLRFKEAGLGTECYAQTPMELEEILRFRPAPQTPAVAHLDRAINVLEEEGRNLIMDFMTRFKDRVFGFVIHDQVEIRARFDDYVAALREVASAAKKVQGCPYLFVEYAVGLEFDLFIKIFKTIEDLERVSACIDIGHIGLRQARAAYLRHHPDKDICALAPHDPELPDVIEDVQGAVRTALDAVLHVIQALGGLAKPLHFHLHDGHPLSTSPLGISDHLSFLDEISIPFEHNNRRSLAPMFGPSGLSRIITLALALLGPERVSFTLEIHPPEGRLPLGDASYLFDHWKDKTNAERMHYWLRILNQNHQLALEACKRNLEAL
jgi:hypothetical protein